MKLTVGTEWVTLEDGKRACIKTYKVSLFSYKKGYNEDWLSVITSKMIPKTFYDTNTVFGGVTECYEMRTVPTLKPEVIKWLMESVKDFNNTPSWSVEEESLNSPNSSYELYFKRESDALNFVSTWSKHKRPLEYRDAFIGVSRVLDLETKKYKFVGGFSNET